MRRANGTPSPASLRTIHRSLLTGVYEVAEGTSEPFEKRVAAIVVHDRFRDDSAERRHALARASRVPARHLMSGRENLITNINCVGCTSSRISRRNLFFVHGRSASADHAPEKSACKICNSQIRLLSQSQELWQSTCSGWRSRHRSCGPSTQFPRSGIAKFAVNVCPVDTSKNTSKTIGCSGGFANFY